MFKRMVRAAAIDSSLYEELETDDRKASIQGIGVMALVIAAYAIGNMNGTGGSLFGAFYALAAWIIPTVICYITAGTIKVTRETREKRTQIARSIAFAQTPGLLYIAAAGTSVSPFFGVFGTAALLWQFVAIMPAIRISLGQKSGRPAMLIAAISLVLYFFVIGFLVRLASAETQV